MSCVKVSFGSALLAGNRANQINVENLKRDPNAIKLRSYKCDECNEWHLTKMSLHNYRFITEVNYRNEVRERAFIKKESEYWNNYFGLE